MSLYQAESFYRARLLTSITALQVVPITVRVSTLPVRTNGLLTLSSNTEYEEICEFDNPDAVNGTIDIIKRGISPSCIALTVSGTDYNNPTYYRQHTANETIRGDVNHIHINQGIGNSTLATNVGVGIVRLSTAAVSPTDPIVVGDNDSRLADSSTTNKGITKLSVAPVSAVNPIACGDNDPRLSVTVVSANGFTGTVDASNDITITSSVNGLVKSNGTTQSAAVEGTDYYKPAGVDVAVADGGTGRSSHTAYAPIFGGTTSTGPQQSGTVGNTGDVMTSNGAGALPTFKPGIVKNGTLLELAVSRSSAVGVDYSASTGVLTNPCVALVWMDGFNGNGTIEINSGGGWSTLYNTMPISSHPILLLEGCEYRCRAEVTAGPSGNGSATLKYTI